MNQSMIKPTIQIFELLYNSLPPLVPEKIKKDMRHALEQIKDNHDLRVEDIEDTMIVFGKQIWPYRKAFQEYIDLAEGRLGEKFFIGKLSPEMRHTFELFKKKGGSFEDLHIGKNIAFFSHDERTALCRALIEMNKEMVRHVVQKVLSSDRNKYEKKIIDFQLLLDDIEHRLDTLRQLADDEQKHPMIADEIRQQVRDFEFGLCSLAPHTEYEAVCRSVEHFEGRTIDIKR